MPLMAARHRQPDLSPISPIHWVSVPQAAALCHRSTETIRNWRKWGYLRAERHGRFWFFDMAEVLALHQRVEAGEIIQPGRPRKAEKKPPRGKGRRRRRGK